jgi:hypothetical protein
MDAIGELGHLTKRLYTCTIRVRKRDIFMQKKLTITLDENVYKGLHKEIGPRKISQFIEDLVRPHVIGKNLDEGYEAMAHDESREAEAIDWSESLISDVDDESR